MEHHARSNQPQIEFIEVVVAAKSTTPQADLDKIYPFPPNPNSAQSTITTVAREITLAGGEATAIPVDTTNYESIQTLIRKTIEASPPSFIASLDLHTYSPQYNKHPPFLQLVPPAN
jgi:hypothetical protein